MVILPVQFRPNECMFQHTILSFVRHAIRSNPIVKLDDTS